MSISRITNKNIFLRIFSFTKEFILRELKKGDVFFPYKIQIPHPLYTFWKDNPPCRYSNIYNAKLYHFINTIPSKYLNKPHILEIIDHPLSILSKYIDGEFTHKKYIDNLPLAKRMYLSNNMKKILVPFYGIVPIMNDYFDLELNDKIIVIRHPMKDNIKNHIKEPSEVLNFLNISSDFHAKGTRFIINAWDKFANNKNNVKLTIVCHNIPEIYENNLPNSITLIKRVPLLSEEKDELFKCADVFIANTLTDGGGAQEALSYGKPLVLFRLYSADDLVSKNNGFIVDVPISIYDTKHYGKTWYTHNDFLDFIEIYNQNGGFLNTIADLCKIFNRYNDHRELVEEHRRNSIKLFYDEFSLDVRNKKIMSIYKDAYKDEK